MSNQSKNIAVTLNDDVVGIMVLTGETIKRFVDGDRFDISGDVVERHDGELILTSLALTPKLTLKK